jgi:hypothetical protein
MNISDPSESMHSSTLFIVDTYQYYTSVAYRDMTCSVLSSRTDQRRKLRLYTKLVSL